MNKTIIILSVLVLTLTFIYFIEFDTSFEKVKNMGTSDKNKDVEVIEEFYYRQVSNTSICKDLNMKEYNQTHCIQTITAY